jgi:nucleoside-diphosphate-sugar epimerase
VVAAMKLAVTGGTGFVGSHLLDRALAAGHQVKALTRRDRPPRPAVTWVRGALDDKVSLAALCEGAEGVIHVAGVLTADAAGFEAGNVAGTKAMLDAAAAAGVQRFVHVSSLAAREPQLSQYGASKARSETLVKTAPIEWSIVRPPAVYGPGDKETLDLFKMARTGVVLLPPAGRLSVIHAEDLAGLLLALVTLQAPHAMVVEPDDGSGGYTHVQFARLLGKAFNRKVLALSMPAPLIRAGAAVDDFVRGARAKLTADRASYFCHPDWVVSPRHRPPPDLWRPRIPTEQGLRDTARWYRQAGWL